MKKEFRLFHKTAGCYGKQIINQNGDPWNPIDFEFKEGLANLEFALQSPDHFVVEQWTGAEDVNDEKIFEGDGVEWTNGKIKRYGIVEFDLNTLSWVIKYGKRQKKLGPIRARNIQIVNDREIRKNRDSATS